MVVIEPFAKVLTTIKRIAPSVIDFFLHLGRRSRIDKKMARLEKDVAVGRRAA
jgi:hypothetical protein